MSGPLHIAYEGPDGRIVITDSLTYCDERIKTVDVVVGGSFMGAYPAAVALRSGVRGIIGNAAGVGRAGSGTAGLELADRFDVPCVAVSEWSARLADGPDTYLSGEVSHLNGAAAALGVQAGATATEAAQQMLVASSGIVGRAAELVDLERALVWNGPEGRVYAMASVGLVLPEHAGQAVCAGSHLGVVTSRYVSGFGFPLAGVICNDCGVGKDASGIAGLGPLDGAGIAAAAVSNQSALIGDGRSTFADGRISHLNQRARQAGVETGMAARDAAILMLRAATQA